MGWGPDDGILWPDRGMSVAELETDTPLTWLGKGLMAPVDLKWSPQGHRCGWRSQERLVRIYKVPQGSETGTYLQSHLKL